MTDLGGKTCIFSHPVYLFLREFSLQDFRGGSFRSFSSDKLIHLHPFHLMSYVFSNFAMQ
ncbi:hypothetical protein C9Z31_12830 [Escherichia coli]|nr:hypothetical protein C9Z31_12830 [Escherichia coli]